MRDLAWIGLTLCPLTASPSPVVGSTLLTELAAEIGSESAEETRISVHQDWRVVCLSEDAAEACRMVSAASAISQSAEPFVVRLSGRLSSDALPLFFFQTPLDLLISKGIEMRVDGGELLRLQYRSCHRSGCLVPFQLDRKLAARFRNGVRLAVRLFEIDGGSVDVDLSLMGFQAAMARLEDNGTRD